jgi:hypothetical protein
MALTLSKTGVEQTQTINAWHVTQSIDALTGTVAYDLVTSGSYRIIGPLYATASWATNALNAKLADSASKEYIASNSSSNAEYTLVFKNSTAALNDYHQLAADGSNGPYYNPSTNTLTVPILSGSSGQFTSITGSLSGSVTNALSASYAISSSHAAASSITTYTTGAYNSTTIYPQGTIYTKFDNVYQSGSSNFDLFSSSLSNLTGTRTLGVNFYNNAGTYNSKILKFRIVGKFSNTSGDDFESYVKLGNSILTSTNIGSVQLQFNTNKPFEILYDIIFQNNTVNTCGSIRYCDQTGDLRAIPISNLYTSDPVNVGQMFGDIQFIVSGSSSTIMTGSLAYIEFIN